MTIISNRLKELRNRAGLSQRELAMKAGTSPQMIYRLEAGRDEALSPRQNTLDKIAGALGVAREVLTGQAPVSKSDSAMNTSRPTEEDDYSINVPVDGAVRNAFTLTSRRYRVPLARIVELAPFLFVLAAEASLDRRQQQHDKWNAAREAMELAAEGFPHLPNTIQYPRGVEAIEADKRSIEAHDILATEIPDSIFLGVVSVDPKYDKDRCNPFTLYLKEVSQTDAVEAADNKPPVARIFSFGRNDTEFSVCSEDALNMAGGDRELMNAIIKGNIILHNMPRDLLDKNAVEARVSWLRAQYDHYKAVMDEFLSELLSKEATS